MATFDCNGSYCILYTQKDVYYIQDGHCFDPITFVDLGATEPTDEEMPQAESEIVVPDGNESV